MNVVVQANPKSRPYVAYRTSPFDQDDFVSRRIMEDGVEQRGGDGGRWDIIYIYYYYHYSSSAMWKLLSSAVYVDT